MTTEATPADEPQVRPFAAFLQELDRGKVHTELGTSLQDLVGAVVSAGKKGAVVLTVEVLPVAGNDEQVTIAAKVTTKLPPRSRANSLFFVTTDRNLTRTDPRQIALPLIAVPDGTPDAAAGGTQ